MTERKSITWKLHLNSSPETVYAMFATDAGRTRFWAEQSHAGDGEFTLTFIGGETLTVPILETDPPRFFSFQYFGGSKVNIEYDERPGGSTDLVLTEMGLSSEDYEENRAGWVSVLLALKAAVDHDVDLRNHDPSRSWAAGFIDN